MSSDKNFLLSIGVLFLLIFFFFKINLFLILSITSLISAYFKPNLFHLLNYAVFRIGGIFLIVIQPIILRIIFILIFGIIGLIMKLFNYDPLLLNKNIKKSYWLDRKKNIKNKEDLKNQY